MNNVEITQAFPLYFQWTNTLVLQNQRNKRLVLFWSSIFKSQVGSIKLPLGILWWIKYWVSAMKQVNLSPLEPLQLPWRAKRPGPVSPHCIVQMVYGLCFKEVQKCRTALGVGGRYWTGRGAVETCAELRCVAPELSSSVAHWLTGGPLCDTNFASSTPLLSSHGWLTVLIQLRDQRYMERWKWAIMK